jgi:hypothetical protein
MIAIPSADVCGPLQLALAVDVPLTFLPSDLQLAGRTDPHIPWMHVHFRSDFWCLASCCGSLHSYNITGDGFLAAPAVRGKPSNSGRLHCPAELGQSSLNPARWRQLKGADHASPVAACLQLNDRRLVN